MSDPLKLRVAELEWAIQSAAGRLPGQLSREELTAILLKSASLREKLGEEGLQRFVKRAKLSALEKTWLELEDEAETISPASGRISGVGWVDRQIVKQDRPFQQVDGSDGVPRYRHIPYGFFLPTALTNASIQAQRRGEPTVLEGYLMLFAWVEWLIASRQLIWSPVTPKPDLLSVMVEAFGIGPEVHRDAPDRLMRLAARLPTWYPFRGGVERARQLLEDTVGETLDVTLAHVDSHGEVPQTPPLVDEVFACRGTDWWQRRGGQGSHHIPAAGGDGSLRIADGLMRFQPDEGEPYQLVREDVVVGWEPAAPFPAVLLRVLPLWVSIRIIALRSGDG